MGQLYLTFVVPYGDSKVRASITAHVEYLLNVVSAILPTLTFTCGLSNVLNSKRWIGITADLVHT